MVFVDSDDFIDDINFLQQIYNNINNCDMAIYGYSYFDETTNKKTPRYVTLSQINKINSKVDKINWLAKTKNLC